MISYDGRRSVGKGSQYNDTIVQRENYLKEVWKNQPKLVSVRTKESMGEKGRGGWAEGEDRVGEVSRVLPSGVKPL